MTVRETVRREIQYEIGPPAPLSKIHVCESKIAGAAITRCGRRMEPRTPGVGIELVYGTIDDERLTSGDVCRVCVKQEVPQ